VAACTPNPPTDLPEYLTADQRHAVAALLEEREGWALLSAADNTSPFLAEMREYEAGYEPYFLTGRFSQREREEFVAAIGREDRQEVYLFINQGGTFEPHRFAELDWLREAGLFRRDSRVGIGDFFSDNVVWFEWNQATQQMEAVEEVFDDDWPVL
jgi:hypothetical protein